jgi:hypothetical protein
MGPPGVSGYLIISQTIPISNLPEKGLTLTCPAPRRAISGGYNITGTVPGAPMPIVVANMIDPSGAAWSVKAGSNGNPNWGMTISVLCAITGP